MHGLLILYKVYETETAAAASGSSRQYESLRDDEAKRDTGQKEKDMSLVAQSDVYGRIRHMLNSPSEKKILTDDDWRELDEQLYEVYPLFHDRLVDLCKLSENEYRVCLLLKTQFSPSQIAVLTCHSKESVSATRRRLYMKAFGKKGAPADWDAIIRSL